MIGNQDSDDLASSTLFLIDFSLSKKFTDSKGQHIEKLVTQEFSGNLAFASPNAFTHGNYSFTFSLIKKRWFDIFNVFNDLPHKWYLTLDWKLKSKFERINSTCRKWEKEEYSLQTLCYNKG